MSRAAAIARSPWVPVVLWMATMFAFSAQSRLPDFGAPESPLDFLVKKSAHFLEYAVLAGLVWRAALRTWPAWRSDRRLPFDVWLVLIGYAVLDEAHQWFVPGRHARVQDVLIDALGAAAMLVWMIRRR